MKLTALDIGSLHHFNDLQLDFTYPLGHKEEGKPLKKICFIGQSGTGKTTLLKIISCLTYTLKKYNQFATLEEIETVKADVKVNDIMLTKYVGQKNENLTYYWNKFSSKVKT